MSETTEVVKTPPELPSSMPTPESARPLESERPKVANETKGGSVDAFPKGEQAVALPQKPVVLGNLVGTKASQFSNALESTPKEHFECNGTITLKMTPTARPEVIFTGFWNGRFIQAAFKAISRAYRERRHRPSRGS